MCTCTHVHMYNIMYILMCTFPSAQTPLRLITWAGIFAMCSFESMHICHICAIWKCAIYQHVPCASAAAAGADETKVLQHSKNQPPPISTSSFLASHQHPTFSTKRKPLACWIDTFVLHIISVVTYGSFNMLGGILNHDIFLFVPNISSKALPWKISAEYQFEFNLT